MTSAARALGVLLLGASLVACQGPLDAMRDAGSRGDARVDAGAVAASDSGADDGGPPAALDAGPPAALDAGSPPDAQTAPPDAGPPPPTGRVLYVEGRAHSPITADLAAGLRAITARNPSSRADVFAKVGDSITKSASFLHCFAGAQVDLGGRAVLQGSIDTFRAGNAAGTDPFQRESVCSVVGWSASAALAGNPSPLDEELTALAPRYATLMYGTNDVGFVAPTAYASNMLDIVDRLLARGVVPVLSSIPPRDDSATADARVPLFNAIVRGIAQGRQLPFMDLHAALLPLAAHGLGPDRIHPTTYSTAAGYRACVLTPAGLNAGYNVRNMLTLESLDRARRAVLSEPAPDSDVTRVAGTGSHANPYEVATLPFTDLRNTTEQGERTFARYDGCASTADESGPEVVYRVVVSRAGTLHAWVFDRGTVDVDLHLLDARGTTAGCLARNDVEVRRAVQPGTYFLVVDSFVSGGMERGGEFLLVARLE